jgi:hypothetical protein
VTQNDEYDDFFGQALAGGGGGGPTHKFHTVGQTVLGEIVSMKRQQQTNFTDGKPKFNVKGEPMMEVVLVLQTELRDWQDVTDKAKLDKETKAPRPTSEDTGLRAVYVKNQMARALGAAALPTAPDGKGRPAVGGQVWLKYVDNEDIGKGNPLPIFEAKYKAPAAPDTNADVFGAAPTAAEQPKDPWATTPAPANSSGEPPF